MKNIDQRIQNCSKTVKKTSKSILANEKLGYYFAEALKMFESAKAEDTTKGMQYKYIEKQNKGMVIKEKIKL